MKVWNIALALLACLGSMSADAAVTIDDKYVVGDQGVLFDDATNLDWARGFEFAPVRPSEGFRLASATEVDRLFDDVGLTPRSGSVLFSPGGGPDFGSASLRAFDFLYTYWRPARPVGPAGGIAPLQAETFILESSGGFPLPTGEIALRYGLLGTRFNGMTNVISWQALASAGSASTAELGRLGAGLALVRDHVQVIPEPDTYLMMLVGFVALGRIVRRGDFLTGRRSLALAVRGSGHPEC